MTNQELTQVNNINLKELSYLQMSSYDFIMVIKGRNMFFDFVFRDWSLVICLSRFDAHRFVPKLYSIWLMLTKFNIHIKLYAFLYTFFRFSHFIFIIFVNLFVCIILNAPECFLYESIRDGRNVNGRLLELTVWSLERHLV